MAEIYGEDGGNPHLDHSHDQPLPERPIDQVHVLVVEHENGGESIYAQALGDLMVMFVTEDIERRRMLNTVLVQQGTYEVAKRLGKRIFWRVYRSDP